MPRRLPPLNPLRAFEAAARHGGMTRAAAELNVTHGAVSHQVRALEEALSVELFERRGRHLALTLAGQQLLPSVQQALDLIADASARLSRPDLDGRLAIKLPIAFAAKWLLPRLARFRDAYPQIELGLLPFRPVPASAARRPISPSITGAGPGSGNGPAHRQHRSLSDLQPAPDPMPGRRCASRRTWPGTR
ncbi:LysR family transcriptional regulator [Hypericibacter adhaerens]|uniref:LysR family transcriptional regulator n=1 Tax=Hypericibacter adhaerens TaxID=2602016 RepID=UPI00124553B4|nr:LysR family transcriptional regulator [Hypericibacter adhaerens]